MINKRISDLSCNKEEFDEVKYLYESALEDSGHFSSMYYNKETWNRRKEDYLQYFSLKHRVTIAVLCPYCS